MDVERNLGRRHWAGSVGINYRNGVWSARAVRIPSVAVTRRGRLWDRVRFVVVCSRAHKHKRTNTRARTHAHAQTDTHTHTHTHMLTHTH